jgi:hypothetical protein
MTNSKQLTSNRSDSSDNDPRFGWPNSSSDDLRADAAVTRPSPASPLEGRGQAIKAKESGVRPQLAPTVSSAETTSSSCHHLSTDDSGVTPGFRRQTECEPCTCQDQLFTYTAVT